MIPMKSCLSRTLVPISLFSSLGIRGWRKGSKMGVEVMRWFRCRAWEEREGIAVRGNEWMSEKGLVFEGGKS